MKKLSIQEVAAHTKDNPGVLYNVEIGALEYYQYENEGEKLELLSKGWFYFSETDHIIAIRLTEGPLKERPVKTDKTKVYELIQDAGDKIKATIDYSSLHFEIKKYFKWRKGDFVKRFFQLGTSRHDQFIAHLSNKGY